MGKETKVKRKPSAKLAIESFGKALNDLQELGYLKKEKFSELTLLRTEFIDKFVEEQFKK